MRNYIIKRVLFLVPVLFIVSFVAFNMNNFSTKLPAMAILEAQKVPKITPELIEQTNEKYGFNKPVLLQYGEWMRKALVLDFGNSYVTGRDVNRSIFIALKYTLLLTLAAIIITIAFSLTLGGLCALFEGRLPDKLCRAFMFILSAMPTYWIGTMAIWFFAVRLKWLPTSGIGSLRNFILPAAALSIGYCGFYFRLIRNSMLDNINENYVYFFRACGVSEGRISRHILRNSLQTAIAAFSMTIPEMLAGTVVIENVFAWPGLGRLCVNSIFNRDVPIIQAYILLLASFYCLFNIFSDIINAAVNPRLRKG